MLFCIGVSGGAQAASDTPVDAAGSQLGVVYDAPNECPDRTAFLREWLTLRGSAGLAVPELGEGVVRIGVRRAGEEYVARVVMVDGAGQCGAQRSLVAPNCKELAADVAASLDLAISDWTCPPRAEKACPPAAPVPDCPSLPPIDPPGEVSQPRRGELGLATGLLWFVPKQRRGAWGHAVLLGYRSPQSLWGAAAGPAWSGQLQVGYWAPEALSAEVPETNVELGLRLTRARLSACPAELRVVGPLAVALCATVEAGLVAVRVGGENQGNRFWGAMGFAPRLRLASDTLFAEIEPSVAFPAMRYRIEGGREVISWVAPEAQARLGARF